jgi:crotonobetainyl-CoA:carnitine CoA-transferase CaiB-like acyl-CoA transferase
MREFESMQAIPGIGEGGALEGVLVIEIAETLAGEFAGGILADMGATVVKIEPPEGSPIRRRGPGLPEEDSLYFQSENRGKQSVVVDLSSLAAQAWFAELVSVAEGVIEDLGPGRLEELALVPSALQAMNPRLSILRLSPFGQSGPLAQERGDDRTAQAFSSGQFVTGFTDRPPQPITVPMADCWSGVHGASGLLAAMLNARRSGVGDVVDLGLYETMLRTQGSSIINFDRTGQVTSRQGNFAQGVVPGNVFETKDGGFVALSGAGEKPFARLCEAIERLDALTDPRFATTAERRKHRDEANELVASWMRQQTLADVESRFAEMGVAGAAVRSADEIVGDPHVEARGMLASLTSYTGAPFQAPGAMPHLARTPAPPPERAPMLGEHSERIGEIAARLRSREPIHAERGSGRGNGGPLDGFRVTDLSQVLAGPFAAGLIADLGAEVVMIELPEEGAPQRRLAGGGPAGFLSTNRNKQSVTLDVRTAAGKAALLDLVRVSDVLVENFRPGTLERWGIGPEPLHEVNPGLVILRISGFGQTGPYSGRSSYNPVACAFGGVTYLGGWPDRAPLRDGITAGDYVTSLFGVLGVLGALVRRDLDGRGQVVDVAMYEGALRMTGDTIAVKTALGIRQERAGGAWAVYPISLTFASSGDRYVEISARSWDEIYAVAARLGIRSDETPESARAALEAFLAGRDIETAVAGLRRAGACCSPVNSAADLYEDPHAWSRGNLVRVEDPDLGSVVIPGVVPTFARAPGKVAGWSRFRGSDNDAVLGGLLRYSDERIAEMTRGDLAAVED